MTKKSFIVPTKFWDFGPTKRKLNEGDLVNLTKYLALYIHIVF